MEYYSVLILNYEWLGCSPQTDGEENTHNSLNSEKLSWCLTRAFSPTDYCSWYWKVLCATRGEGKNQLNHKPFNLHWSPSLQGTLAKLVTQTREYPPTDWI